MRWVTEKQKAEMNKIAAATVVNDIIDCGSVSVGKKLRAVASIGNKVYYIKLCACAFQVSPARTGW